MRTDVFKSPHRYRCRAKIDNIQRNMNYFYETLDNGVLGKIYLQLKNVSKSNELKEKYVAMWEELRNRKFPYFMYGTIAWERARKQELPNPFHILLQSTTDVHNCSDCFENNSNCQHQCCILKVKQYAAKLGLHLKLSKSKKNDKSDKSNKNDIKVTRMI